MPDNPNEGKCLHCTYYKETPGAHVCKAPRKGGWDHVRDKEWEDEVDCYRVNTDGTCPFWAEDA